MRSDSSETNAFFSWTSWIQCSIISDESPVSGIQKQKTCFVDLCGRTVYVVTQGMTALHEMLKNKSYVSKDFWFQLNLE